MYILIFYALCVTLILFGFYHYITVKKEYEEDPYKKYDILSDLFSVNNIVIFTIIYSISFALIYFSFDDKADILSMIGVTDNDYSKLNNIAKTTLINPNILKNTICFRIPCAKAILKKRARLKKPAMRLKTIPFFATKKIDFFNKECMCYEFFFP